jgi:hypothetical protein
MKPAVPVCLALGLCAVVVVTSCKSKGDGGNWAHQNNADNLAGLFTRVVANMKSGKPEAAVALIKGLIPGEASARAALVENVDGATLAAMLSHYRTLAARMDPAQAGRGFKTERDQIKVHAATTEQIAGGAAAAVEFPEGAREAAKSILRPGVTFYEVELTEPGADSGTKFHLLYWDGAEWRMLGAVWQATRR